MLILRGMTSRAALQQLADRIIVAIRALSPPELTDLQVSASLGILVWHPGGPDQPEQVLAMAGQGPLPVQGGGARAGDDHLGSTGIPSPVSCAFPKFFVR